LLGRENEQSKMPPFWGSPAIVSAFLIFSRRRSGKAMLSSFPPSLSQRPSKQNARVHTKRLRNQNEK
jgi:hypothetical protein